MFGGIFIIKATPYFLAPTRPVHARVLIVEGWLGQEGLEFARTLAKSNHYDLILTPGGRIERGFDETTYGTFANLGAHRLRAMGYAETNLMAVPSYDTPKDRTYHSARSVREFLLKTPHRSFDILSDGVHSRRSWFLYRQAMGPEFKVGIYAAPTDGFTLEHWYRKSAGVRAVLDEAIAFIYARLLFRPPTNEIPPELRVFPAQTSAPVSELPPGPSSSPR